MHGPGMTVTLSRDREAVDRLSDPTFAAAWRSLVADCPWSTQCQMAGFVLGWYRIHAAAYESVVVEGRDEAGDLIGLLTLARRRDGGPLVAAGDFQAEYQVWLSRPQDGTTFIDGALDALESAFPSGRLQLMYLPPALPDTAMTRRMTGTRFISIRGYPRGFVDLADVGQAEDSLRKGHNRSRMNTLRRRGEIRLETLETVEQLEAEMDHIAVLCDLRQGAINDALPFHSNPLKRPFYLALMAEGLLHVTVLRVGATMASVHLDHRNPDSVLLGVMAHEPSMARQSPGSLHLLLLAPDLAARGIARLDLSPSGAPTYKDRFATRYDTAHRMSVEFGRVGRVRASVRHQAINGARRVLGTVGQTPASAREAVGELRGRVGGILRRNNASLRRRTAPVRVDPARGGADAEVRPPPRRGPVVRPTGHADRR